MITRPLARHTRAAAVATAALALMLGGCSSQDAEPQTADAQEPTTAGPEDDPSPAAAVGTTYPVTIDECDTDVEVEAAPQGVLTIGTAAISIMDAAGASQQIVGRSGEFDAPLPESLSTPPDDAEIIDPADPSAEAILTSGADLVYGYGLFNATPEQLEQAGIEILTVQGECGHDASTSSGEVDFTTVSNDIRRLGQIFDTSDVAEPNATALEERVEELSERVEPDRATAAWLYFFSSTDDLSGYGGVGMPAAVLEAAGLDNAYGGESEAYLTIQMESLLAEDPEWIVLNYGLYGERAEDAEAQFRAQKGAGELTAVQEGRIALVPGTASEPSPRAADGLAAIIDATTAG